MCGLVVSGSANMKCFKGHILDTHQALLLYFSAHTLTKESSFDRKICISSQYIKSVSTNLWTPGVRINNNKTT